LILLPHGGTNDRPLTEQKKMTNEFTVVLKNGTVGTISDSTLDGQHPSVFIGEVVNVHLHDENGNPIEAQGVLAEVL
jgi:hypothetical protein